MRVKLQLAKREDLTVEELKHHFKYDPVTGDFTRVVGFDSWCREIPDNHLIIECNNRGYRWVRFKNLNFLVHRLVWLYMTGDHPTDEIDHIDGDRQNNSWSNLRHVTAFENSRNQGERKDNTSGCRGVTFSKRNRKWCTRISHKGVRYSLGYFVNIEDAIQTRKQAEKDFKYHPNHAARSSWDL